MVVSKVEKITHSQKAQKMIKCVVWDLDNTLWDGLLLEDGQVFVREHVVEIIQTLDKRGILQSVASKNDYHQAMAKLKELNLSDYFIYPQINWNPKSFSIAEIAKLINISTETIALIDDQVFEREEVRFSLPEVTCINADKLDNLLNRPEMNPRFITEDSRKRRLMYISDIERKKAESEFVGTQEAFLATLKMQLTISVACEVDLQRAEELTIRTNQLNTTGYTYSYDELNQFRQSEQHKLFIASLEDKYGTYGKIGLALVELHEQVWLIKLFLMSCRVMSRGVGTVMLNYLIKLAQENNVRLRAEFVSNERNRMMYIAYKFAGFKEFEKTDECVILENELMQAQPLPAYVQVNIN